MTSREEAIKELVQAACDEQNLSELRIAAIDALGAVGGSYARNILLALMKDVGSLTTLRAAATRALGQAANRE